MTQKKAIGFTRPHIIIKKRKLRKSDTLQVFA